MMDILSSITASSPSGFFWKNTNEYKGLDAVGGAFMLDVLTKIGKVCDDAANQGGDITLALDLTVDGKAEPTMTLTGVTRKSLAKGQRKASHLGEDVVKAAEHSADVHGKKRAK